MTNMKQEWYIVRTKLIVSLVESLVYRMRSTGIDTLGKLVIFDNSINHQSLIREIADNNRYLEYRNDMAKFLPPNNTIITHSVCLKDGYFKNLMPMLTFKIDENNIISGGIECKGIPDELIGLNNIEQYISVSEVEGNSVYLGWHIHQGVNND